MNSWKSYIYSELKFEFTRSRGSGGQHVNKTETAVYVRWSLENSQLFSFEQKVFIKNNLKNELLESGEILVRSEVHRDREMNKKDGIAKLILIIEKALFKPKIRKKTRPTHSSKQKRIQTKKIRSETKLNRQKIKAD